MTGWKLTLRLWYYDAIMAIFNRKNLFAWCIFVCANNSDYLSVFSLALNFSNIAMIKERENFYMGTRDPLCYVILEGLSEFSSILIFARSPIILIQTFRFLCPSSILQISSNLYLQIRRSVRQFFTLGPKKKKEE